MQKERGGYTNSAPMVPAVRSLTNHQSPLSRANMNQGSSEQKSPRVEHVGDLADRQYLDGHLDRVVHPRFIPLQPDRQCCYTIKQICPPVPYIDAHNLLLVRRLITFCVLTVTKENALDREQHVHITIRNPSGRCNISNSAKCLADTDMFRRLFLNFHSNASSNLSFIYTGSDERDHGQLTWGASLLGSILRTVSRLPS